MEKLDKDQLQKEIRQLKEKSRNHTSESAPFSELVGDSTLAMLSSLSDCQAEQYLKLAKDSDIPKTYLVLSKRLKDSALANICLEYLLHPTLTVRIIGAGEIGIWLYGTQDRLASQALARVLRNVNESPEVKWLAYSSLELINKGKSTHLQPNTGTYALESQTEFDWEFIDSFLVDN